MRSSCCRIAKWFSRSFCQARANAVVVDRLLHVWKANSCCFVQPLLCAAALYLCFCVAGAAAAVAQQITSSRVEMQVNCTQQQRGEKHTSHGL